MAAGVLVPAIALELVACAVFGFVDYLYGAVSPAWWAVFALPLALILLTCGLAVCTALPWSGTGLSRRAPYALAVVAARGVAALTIRRSCASRKRPRCLCGLELGKC